MDERTGVTHEPKPDQMPILSAVARPTPSRRPSVLPPRIARVQTPVMVPEPTRAPPPAERAVARPVQYRLEILDALTEADVDGFVDSGFAQDASFSMNLDGTWRQTSLEADVPGDADEE